MTWPVAYRGPEGLGRAREPPRAPRWRTIEIRNEGELNLAHVTVTWTFLVGGAFVLVGVVRRRFGCHK